MWRASRPPERVFTNSEMWVPGLWQSAHLEFMVCAVISAAWADVRGLIFWFGRNRGATAAVTMTVPPRMAPAVMKERVLLMRFSMTWNCLYGKREGLIYQDLF